jgi:hypothetical protein
MASPFKRKIAANVGVAPVVVYTVPALKVATLIDVTCANVEATGLNTLATVQQITGGGTINLIKNGPVPTGGAMVVVGEPRRVVMEAGDQLSVVASVAASIDVAASFIEQDA